MAESRVEAPSVPAEEPLTEPMNEDLDVSRTVVNASYRSTPWAAQKEKDASTSTVVQVLMLSESNVCRSVLAEAIMTNQLAECGLGDMVQVESRGTRDYSIGEGADVSVQAAAQTMGLEIRQDFKAQQVDFEKDIVKFDVVFVMDKYTAADILREVRVRPRSRKQTLAKGVHATLGSSHK